MFSFCVELRLLLLHICRSITNIANIAHTPCAARHGFYFRQLYQLRMQFAFRVRGIPFISFANASKSYQGVLI